MDPLTDVRLRARACHAEALAANGDDRSAVAITATAARLRNLAITASSPRSHPAEGALGDCERARRLVNVDAALPPGLRELVIAHQIAHHELSDDPVGPVGTFDHAPAAAARAVGHSHQERRATAAEAFAAELLCPADWTRTEVVERGRRPSELARALGLPQHVVAAQAIRGVCLPPLRDKARRRGQAHALDVAQTAAATWTGGALVIEAGPGTGKTATLVGRVTHLLGAGVDPSAIVILTFSTRAAAELAARVADASPEASGRLWIGTTHGFGFQVIGDWHHRAGRGSHPRVLDREGALELLERRLDTLPLAGARELGDPAAGLGRAMRLIERCKDEMVSCDDYAAAAGRDPVDRRGADDVAGVYAAYEKALQDADAIDLGDLLAVATRLLEDHDDIADHYAARFRHILVDEIQDLNPASTRLLLALRGATTCLWAVGDPRQSIYRFRGAAPAAFDAFAATFGADTLRLDRSYRATPQIVGAFSAFASTMGGGRQAWSAERPSGGPVRLMSAATTAGEIAALRDRVEDLRRDGVGYGEQAILARTHRTLETIGAGLERLGVPVAYLGDLFARDDVRDLLALLSIPAEPGGLGLLRVATRPPYGVPRADVLAAIRWAAERGATTLEALAQASAIPGVAARSGRELASLGRRISAAGPNATAWTTLATWLFETHDGSVLAEAPTTRRIAVYQLLRLAADERSGPAAFLRRVRRIAALGGGREHGVIAPEARPDDAVQALTIHGAKGLEYDAVHLPQASSRHLPLCHRSGGHPPPPTLSRLAMSPEEHDAEERALWFVALSRAREHLTISYARGGGASREARPSPFLSRVGPLVETRHRDPGPTAAGATRSPPPPRGAYLARELDTFLRCPARFRYDVVDGLAAATPPSAQGRLLRAVLAAARILERIAARGASPTYADAEAALNATWATSGPTGHRREGAYRRIADRVVARLAEIVAIEVDAVHHQAEWAVDLGPAILLVRPHRIVETPWGVTVQMIGARRGDRAIVEALRVAARSAFPGRPVAVETIDLDDGEAVASDPVGGDAALSPYRDAVAAIESGDFPPKAGPHCPACPFFLVCGA